MAHNILPPFFQFLSSQLRSQTLAAAACGFSRSLAGLAGQKMWVPLKIVVVTTGVEPDGNKEEEGCLLPGTQTPPPPTPPTPPPGSQLTRFPCLLKRQKGHCSTDRLCCRKCKLPQQTSEGLEQHGRFCLGAVVTPVGHFRCGDTNGSSSGGSDTLQSEMIGLAEMLCMAKCFHGASPFLG